MFILIITLAILMISGTQFKAVAQLETLKTELEKARMLVTENICEPVKSTRVGMLLMAPNPDNKTWDLLQIYFPEYGGPNTIVIIDLGENSQKIVKTDRGWNFHLCPSVIAPNGKLFISILDNRLRQKICIYDPAKNELKLNAVEMPDELLGETHPLVLGTDGKIYAIGQHPSKTAAAAQIDPDTLKVEFYGSIGPSHAPNPCWGYSGGADDRYIYIASGKIPWYLIAFDREKRKWSVLAETEPVGGYIGVSQRHDGCVATVTRGEGKQTERYWLYEGKLIPMKSANETPPWGKMEGLIKFPKKPEIKADFVDPDADGWAEIWVRISEEGSYEWKRYRYQVPLYPQSIYRLREMHDGRLFGTCGAYLGNFIYDPKENKAVHLGKCQLSHYSTAFFMGKIYMSGYPNSPLYVFDPSSPWTTGKIIEGRLISDDDPKANPRRLFYMGSINLAGTHKMYAAAVGADGKIYFGGRWIRNGECGGLAWYDPKTGEFGGIWRPFSNYQITHIAPVNNGEILVISTKAVNDPVLGKPKPEQGALLFFDTRKMELVGKFEPVARARGTGPIVSVGGSLVMGWTENPEDPRSSILYLVDVNFPRIVYSHRLPFPLPVAIGSNQQEPWDFRLGPDGKVWTFIENVLVRIEPKDGSIQPVGRLNIGGPLAFSNGEVYLGGTTTLRRIKLP
ncbi:MAG: hypothetical protein RMK18_08290 [Armatimonadota bacterium]|nr:hypothetical protein [Armatimonadota bacterium]MCX7777848.1 hypothetical protein [Armatimonadota bacterium]MDW8025840.1 hypothetical protein [Armatimonadota bacterium]